MANLIINHSSESLFIYNVVPLTHFNYIYNSSTQSA